MKIIRGLHNFREAFAPCVVTIGNFDGLHLGHQQMLAELGRQSKLYQVPAIVMTFEPTPTEFFSPEQASPRLTRFREKAFLLKKYNIDAVLLLNFNKKLAALSAQDFIIQILVKQLKTRLLLIGDDFYFGARREGSVELLQRAAKEFGFTVITMPTVLHEQRRISSTLVRHYLANGDLEQAQKLLGRPYHMLGRVIHGNKRGRLINFPTANIHIKRTKSPLFGVYAVEMLGVASYPVPGVANIGSRPTIDGTRVLLEVHLFDFDQDIYGQQVQVNFLYKLRDEQRYASMEALQAQIYRDAAEARAYFSQKHAIPN